MNSVESKFQTGDSCGDGSVVFPLSMLDVGESARIVSFRGGRGIHNRLAALGITPGTVVTKIKDNHSGPAIIRVKDSRLALGRGILHRIDVDRVFEETEL
jgi:ferrous iron transport protein A